jgi:hypothetical protein
LFLTKCFFFDAIAFFGKLFHKTFIFDGSKIYSNVEQSAQHGRSASHHGYTTISYGIFIAFSSSFADQIEQFKCALCNFHRHHCRYFCGLLNFFTAKHLLLVGVFWQPESLKNKVVGFSIPIDIGQKFGSKSRRFCGVEFHCFFDG